jgi:L-threonylcarbamoyladenylate synthase
MISITERAKLAANMIRISNQDLETAENLLLNGDVVAIPTETVYGLAASISQENAIRKVFQLKKRPFFDPLIVHVANLKQAKELTSSWSPLTDFIARSFWPGALTLVLPKAASVSSLITSGLETVAVRYPDHDMALQIIKKVGPLAAPSANKFGKTSPTQAHHVREEFKTEKIFVLDGGACDIGIESTVIEINANDSVISILRPGGVSHFDLVETLKKWSQPVEVKRSASQKSPGHLEHHYMPDLPFFLIFEGENIHDQLQIFAAKAGPQMSRGFELKLSNEPAQAARELYSQLRVAKVGEFDFIYYTVSAEQFRNSDWDAILDRISRASLRMSDQIMRRLKRVD